MSCSDSVFSVFVVGPTASGKSDLAVNIAEKYNGEVVSADSMQIYRFMDIASAKVTEEEMRGIKHHMIVFLDPSSDYSVADYKKQASLCIKDISSRSKLPVVVGGTGLYIDSLLNNLSYLEFKRDSSIRALLEKRADSEGLSVLYSELEKTDPVTASKIHPNNRKKIIHALEIYLQTGQTITQQNEQSFKDGKFIDPLIFGLDAENRQFLYDRINRRVDIMLEKGLVNEAKDFYSRFGTGTSSQAIGYKELLPYLKKEAPLEECVEKLKMQTRRYAKRQLTWFRRNENINWIYIDKTDDPMDTVERIMKERGVT